MCSYLDQVGSTYYFRRTVPKDLVGTFLTNSGRARTEWKYTLGTKDRETAKRRLRPHEIETDSLIDNARADAISLEQPLPVSPAAQKRELDMEAARLELAQESQARKAERRYLHKLWYKRRQTSTAELTPEQAAAIDLLREQDAEIEELKRAVAIMEAGNAALGIPPTVSRRSAPLLSITELFERYAKSGAANPKTVTKWRSAVARLVVHLGHDDAAAVTRMDMNGWTAALVTRGLSKKTVVDGYLPAASAAFAMAFESDQIPANPVAGLKVRAPKPTKLRHSDLTDDEAATILRASRSPQPAKLAASHVLARRWVPWLCAYTGARVGEITQLRAMDIKLEGGIWCIHITPEAGSVKTNEARLVPLHSHLIEQGLTQLAVTGDTTPLFYTKGAGNEVNPGSKIRAADIAKWVRSLGIEAPQPNHGWRHRFKTMTRAAHIREDLADKIQGHSPATEGRKYGLGPLRILRDAIESLPRFEV